MPIQEASGFCDYCKRPVLGRREGVNHVLHAIISIFSCGLWVIPWAIIAMTTGYAEYACPTCGGVVTVPR